MLCPRPPFNPTVFAESLALQLGARYQPFAKALAEKREDRRISIEVTQSAASITGGQVVGVAIHKLDLSGLAAEDAFTRVVREPLEVLLGQEPDQQVIVMVDALDEALTYSGDMNIVSLLAHVEYLPPGARFILTSRQVEEIELAFRKATKFFLSSERFNTHNQEDIEHFVAGQLRRNDKLSEELSSTQIGGCGEAFRPGGKPLQWHCKTMEEQESPLRHEPQAAPEAA